MCLAEKLTKVQTLLLVLIVAHLPFGESHGIFDRYTEVRAITYMAAIYALIPRRPS